MESVKRNQLIRTIGGKRLVHIASCPYIRDWDIEGCEVLDKVKYNKMSICPTCEKSVYIREGATDFEKKQNQYEKLFETVSASKVRSLFITQGAKTRLVNERLYIKAKRDSWYIDFSLGEIRLFHGNYDIAAREDQEEAFSKMGYHEHKVGNSFNAAISQIVRYDYKQAEKAHKKARKRQRKLKFSDVITDSDSYSELYSEYDYLY